MLEFAASDDGYIAELSTFVEIPSVSRDANVETMRQAAEWLAAQISFANGRVEQTTGHPVVRGEWLGAPGLPTILVYGHYDVQPTGDLAEWKTPPFSLVRDGDVIRGRGVTDDKGPVLIVLKVAQAFMAQEGKLPLNVKFLFEGEEEIGSPNLGELSSRNSPISGEFAGLGWRIVRAMSISPLCLSAAGHLLRTWQQPDRGRTQLAQQRHCPGCCWSP